MKQYIGNLSAGEQIIDLNIAHLAAGNYIYSVKVSNLSGTFRQSRLFTKR
jgi:hypothetical protein